MNCPKCKYEVKGNLSICPRCGASLVERKTTKSVKAVKGTKSKIKLQDDSSLVGGTVSQGSFIHLKKSAKKKEVSLKDYNNYIDYKEAKEKLQNNVENNPFAGIDTFANKKKKPVHIYSNQDLFTKVDSNTGIADQKKSSFQEQDLTQGRFFGTEKKESSSPVEVKKDPPFPSQQNLAPSQSLFGIQKVVKNDKVPEKKKKEKKPEKKGMRPFQLFAYCVVIALWVAVLWYLYTSSNETYYFSEKEENNEIVMNTSGPTLDEEMAQYKGVSKSGQVGGSSSEGVTSIVYDNQYLKQFTLKKEEDVYKLISTDSIKQKSNCPANIVKIENEIITNYGIVAVNLCEMDYDFALEIRDVTKYIYTNYPQARNYLTNLTLANVEEGSSFIAAFMPVFSFATSKTDSGYPVAVKTQILLNAKYFLNPSKIKSSVTYGEKSGYFPSNASRSSTVAHEFGHYLSYVALLNYYQSEQLNYVKSSQATLLYQVYADFNEGTFSYNLLREAYESYSLLYSSDSFDEFRASISTYAMAKDTQGNYIYDETIAEAFHDVYLNGDLAKPASSYIVKTLMSKL